MAKIMFTIPEHDVSFDITNDPLTVLLIAEDDDGVETEILESQYRSGMAVTKPKTKE